MMISKAFQASWIILMVTSIITGLSGLIMILSPQFFMANEIQGYLGQSWSNLESSNVELFGYFMHDIRLLGFTQFTASVLMILVVLFYYRKSDKAAWFICLIGIMLGLGSSLGLNLPIGDPFVLTFVGVLLAADCVALALGAKPLLMQKEKA
jgi:hypothetical protein